MRPYFRSKRLARQIRRVDLRHRCLTLGNPWSMEGNGWREAVLITSQATPSGVRSPRALLASSIEPSCGRWVESELETVTLEKGVP